MVTGHKKVLTEDEIDQLIDDHILQRIEYQKEQYAETQGEMAFDARGGEF